MMYKARIVALLATALLINPGWAQEEQEASPASEAETAGSSMTVPSSEAPIDISADRNTYDLRTGVVEYIEDVFIERGPMQIRSDRAIFREIEGEIAEIELFGSPVEWQDQLEDGTIVSGEADNIFFDVIANVVTLTGNGVIRHEQGEFTGDRLVYDLTNENLSSSSEGDNRVRARIEPGALPDDN